MKFAKQRSLILAFVCAIALVGTQLVGVADAASKHPANNGDNGMKISPLRTDLVVKPGQSKSVTIDVTNITKGQLTLEPIENDFVAGNEEGQPAIILNKDSYAPTHSLKRFMMPLSNFTLDAGKSRAVKLTINVPPSAQPGGYFGALRFVPATKGNQPVALNSSVASLVLMTVPGSKDQKLLLTNFEIQQKGQSPGIFGFSNSKNLNLLVRFQNKGNVQEAPFGQINVTKGKDQVYSYNFNNKSPKDEILPDSARRWDVPLKNLGSFGKYTVSGTFSYANGKSIQVSKSIWIIPTSYIIGAIVAIIVIILIIFGIRGFLKSYKRRVLRGSRR